MSKRNENLIKFSNWLAPNQSKFEMILSAIAAIALIMKMQHIQSMNFLLTISLSTLAVLFYISSFATPPEDFTIMDLFANKLLHWGSAIAIIGILFTIQNWKGSVQMIVAGSGALLIGIVISFMKSESRLSITKPTLILLLALALLFTPKEKLIKPIHSAQNYHSN